MARCLTLAVAILLLASLMDANAADPGDNALIINVSKVEIASALPGLCRVDSVVAEVLAGGSFLPNQKLSLQVPCGGYLQPRPLLPATDEHQPQLIDPDVLAASKVAGVHLDDAGKLLWTPTPPYRHWGAIWGFRLFEGVGISNRHAV
jgi:hypothetical protein